MEGILAALADPMRWRLVELLAERPRPVGVLAQLAGARQPQTTKHLQTLERAGLVTSQRSGQRRVYALQPRPLLDLASALGRLAADAVDNRETFDEYGATQRSEREAAAEDGWADGRSFRFSRQFAADTGLVWRHLTEADLLARWWTPDDLRVSELVFEAHPGGRIIQEYRDAEDSGTDAIAGRAEGVVETVRPEERLTYRLSPLLPDGEPAFTAHVELSLRAHAAGTALDVEYRITGSAVDAADFIAGIRLGFTQSLDHLAAAVAAPEPPTRRRP
jgi:uncharacterized protein YndB with AHSA1/START domain